MMSKARYDRTFDAIVVHWEVVPATDTETMQGLVGSLASRGVVIESWSGNPGRPGTETDPGSVFDRLRAEGIPPGATLVVAEREQQVPDRVAHIPYSSHLAVLLGEQVARRDALRVPHIDADPSWVFQFEGEPDHLPRVRETLCALADGHIGVRGSAEEEPPGSDPRVLAIGVYDDEVPPSLLNGPRFTQVPLDLPEAEADIWTLDLRHGLLSRVRETPAGTSRSLRFVSLARPGCAVLRVEAPQGSMNPGSPLAGGPGVTLDEDGTLGIARSSRGTIVAAAGDRTGSQETTETLERIAAYVSGPDQDPAAEDARAFLSELEEVGSDRLLAEHRLSWARRWRDAVVRIEGDSTSEKALRFALFHLMSSAPIRGEAAVGARGLTGPAYRGHVFWDSDVYVLPALAATVPEAARAMIEYRLRRLPAARREAGRLGAAGARFPWESADDGTDVTPDSWVSPEGVEMPIRTGSHELHVVADVAWAVRHYARWVGDEALLSGAGRALMLETARFWASQIQFDEAGQAHLAGVIGPDEYHQLVDDNAYTNVMARANLRWAANLARRFGGADRGEIAEWLRLADGLVDGYDGSTGLYEQFAGYSALEPLLIEDVAKPPIAADVFLGRDRVAGSQLVKQADVLMLHHLVPDEVPPGSLGPNLRHYLPRTAHGSSLSPPIHASLLARAGRVDDALEWFRLTARLDLEDVTGTSAGGIHLGAMGGLWQAFTFGFLGVSVDDGAVRVDPRLPREWDSVTQNLVVVGVRLKLTVTQDEVIIEADEPLRVTCGDQRASHPATGFRFVKTTRGWEALS